MFTYNLHTTCVSLLKIWGDERLPGGGGGGKFPIAPPPLHVQQMQPWCVHVHYYTSYVYVYCILHVCIQCVYNHEQKMPTIIELLSVIKKWIELHVHVHVQVQ